MNRRTRRNTTQLLLAANALLLGGLLWTQVADRPLLAQEAIGQSRSSAGTPYVAPNSAALMKRTMDEIGSMKKELSDMTKLLKSGGVKVQVTNLDELATASTEP